VSLQTRLARLEGVDGGLPTQAELKDAYALSDRHFRAIQAQGIFGPEHYETPEPAELTAMKKAGASGRVAAAREIIQRYRRARGRDDSHLTVEERRANAKAAIERALAEYQPREEGDAPASGLPE
jgi:hypothetical protein